MPEPIRALAIFGTRPEAIKLAPVLRELESRPGFRTRVCITAQHREMLDQVLGLFNIRPDHDLDLMREDQSLFQLTSEAIRRLEPVLLSERPDVVLVQGDTTTTFVASLAAYYLRIPIAHVEAGLRTEEKFSPFPEEMNRRLADALADLYLAPTQSAADNLKREGVLPERVFVTGNTVIDALQSIQKQQSTPEVQRRFEETFLRDYGVPMDRPLVLVTGHRRESFGPEFENICHALRGLVEGDEDVRIVYPVHLNPNVQRPVQRILSGAPRVHLLPPLDYGPFVWLMGRCSFVLTDSGGVQEEAPSLAKPVLVMRRTTERPEGIEAGVARLVGTDRDSILRESRRLLHDPDAHREMARAVNPYGDGKAAQRIAEILEQRLSGA